MADKESLSFSERVIWKILKVLPRRSQEPQHVSSYRPRTRSRGAGDIEPVIRHLGPRKRHLSSDSLCDGRDSRQPFNTDQQTSSIFFRLPKEVRLMVYEEVLGGKIFHIVRRREKLGHKLCRGNGDPNQCISGICRGYRTPSGIYAGRGDGGLIPVLQTCRMIYSEAIGMLYSENVFDFDSLESFVSFSCESLPQRLDCVRRIQFDFRFNLSVLYAECTPHTNWPRWERTWRIVASMLALQEVRMRLSWPQMWKCAGEESRILGPLRMVTGLRQFEVALPSLRSTNVTNLEEMPFHVVTS